jgi:hypothetical protein
MKSETNRVNSSLGCRLMILGSRPSFSLLAEMELFRLPDALAVAAVVVVDGAAFADCWGETAVAGDGLDNATVDGEGGSSTRCRLRGRDVSSSLLWDICPSCGDVVPVIPIDGAAVVVVVVVVVVFDDGRSAAGVVVAAGGIAAALLSSSLSIESRSIVLWAERCCV